MGALVAHLVRALTCIKPRFDSKLTFAASHLRLLSSLSCLSLLLLLNKEEMPKKYSFKKMTSIGRQTFLCSVKKRMRLS